MAQKYADKLIYIDPEQRDFTVSQYPNEAELKNKAIVVPLNYVPEWDRQMIMAGRTVSAGHLPKVFIHPGRIYGLRKIDAFLKALIELKSENPDLSNRIQFVQYGEIKPKYQKMISDYHLEEIMHLESKISYEDAEQKMIESDGLVLFDTIMPEEMIQPYLPSKAIEYMLLRKDMLIITTSKSPAWRIFTGLGYQCCRYNTEEIKNQIKKLISTDTHLHEYDIASFENTKATSELKAYVESKLI
ncbi:MAG: hypothetical protein EOM64_06765 [Erysipelotrichia bacterium]|nr:hypothetical protein [Erysipelotrichia bacterium]